MCLSLYLYILGNLFLQEDLLLVQLCIAKLLHIQLRQWKLFLCLGKFLLQQLILLFPFRSLSPNSASCCFHSSTFLLDLWFSTLSLLISLTYSVKFVSCTRVWWLASLNFHSMSKFFSLHSLSPEVLQSQPPYSLLSDDSATVQTAAHSFQPLEIRWFVRAPGTAHWVPLALGGTAVGMTQRWRVTRCPLEEHGTLEIESPSPTELSLQISSSTWYRCGFGRWAPMW